tara:strand:- start:5987 stop:6502 length:516 start_codon:yes stop_codon:yes gene_type:complete
MSCAIIKKGKQMKKFQQGDVLFKEIDKTEFLKLKAEEEKKHYSNFKITSGLNSGDVYDKNIEIKNKRSDGETIDHSLSNNKCTVALGEATGHHHRFETATEGATITAYSNSGWRSSDDPAQCNFVLIEGKDAVGTLTHEEHNPIHVPSGCYKIDIVKEFDHFSQLTRSVID